MRSYASKLRLWGRSGLGSDYTRPDDEPDDERRPSERRGRALTTVGESVRPSLGPRLPFTLGRFTLCRELGAGGMATVYLSKMRLGAGLERLVALKTIHGHLAKQQTFIDMFLDEAKIASQISHPNVCAVYDFGKEGDEYFLAMEYLVGEPLFDFINQVVAKRAQSDGLMQALPFLAARILADACEGLHAAHTATGADGSRLDIVHRDVSPQNLFVTYDGTVKVVDFGCAKALERVTQTNTGVMKGKVSYAAPEQLRAEPVDARADIFALGVCLWETLTLRQLFRRDTAIKTAMAVLEEPIERADAVAQWVPAELADIAARALRRDRAERYSTAREMGRDLRGFIARSGAPFESAELAEWMRYLFEERYEQTLAMVANVEALEAPAASADSAASAAPAATTEAPSRDSAVVRAPRLSLEDDREQPGALPSTGPALVQEEKDVPVRIPSKLGRWIVSGLVALAAVFGAVTEEGIDLRVLLSGMFTTQDASDAGGPPERESVDTLEPASLLAPSPTDPALQEEDDLPGVPDREGPTTSEDGVEGEAPTEDPSPEPPATRVPERPTHRSRPARDRPRASDDDALEDDAYVSPVEATGILRVVAAGGWATVEHEGRSLGRTPLEVTLPTGRQQLRILPSGEGPGETIRVTIEPGTLKTLRLEVDEAPGGGATSP